MLYKAVHGSLVNDLVISLSVHLLELALTYPKNQSSGVAGKEVVSITKSSSGGRGGSGLPEPVDLQYDSWFQSDCLSSNLRQNIAVVYKRNSVSGSSNGTTSDGVISPETGVTIDDGDADLTDNDQTMEIDQVSDSKCAT